MLILLFLPFNDFDFFAHLFLFIGGLASGARNSFCSAILIAFI